MSQERSKGWVVVTGATGGIGHAIARRLNQAGYGIVLHYAANRSSATALQSEITESGGHCAVVRADLRSESGIQCLVDSVDRLLASGYTRKLHGLVNNAARMLGPSLKNATFAEFDEYFQLNTKAPLFLTQELSRRMGEGGSIVNISSAAAHFSSPGDIIYAMSKAAIESLTLNAAEELARSGIRINAVVPGFTDNGHRAFRDPDVQAYMSGFSVLGGVSRPDVVAEAVAFLMSDSSSRSTGSLLDVSGGSALGARSRSNMSLRGRETKGSV